MARNIEIDIEALVRAEALLEAYLSEKLPYGNFREGSHLHDIVVRAFAYVYALLDKEASSVRDRQSLLKLASVTDVSADAAVDDLVSNWFLTRKTGTAATGILTVVLSDQAPPFVTIPVETEFTYDTGAVFTIDSPTPLTFLRDDMLVEVNPSTQQTVYKFMVPIVAVIPGTIGNIPAARFRSFDPFDPSALYVETTSSITTATEDETTEALLERAEIAITARGFLSNRSIETTLVDSVSSLQEVVVVGAGDPEMARDLIEDVAAGISVHSLGHVNVYAHLPLVPGSVFPSDGTSVTIPAVQQATQGGLTTVTITPTSADLFPFMRISRLSVFSPFNPGQATSMYRQSHFTSVNSEGTTLYHYWNDNPETSFEYTTGTTLPLADNEYRISYGDSLYTGSEIQPVQITFNESFNSRNFTLEYSGVRDLAFVRATLDNRDLRSVCADLEPYSFYPALASFTLSYYKSLDAPADLPVEQVKSGLCTFINTFPKDRVLRVSDIISYFLSTFSLFVSGVGMPLTVNYRLDLPSGSQVLFQSTDQISVEDLSLLVDSRSFSLGDRLSNQVSDRTCRVVCFEDLITITEI